MKWILRPLSVAKNLSIGLSVLTLCLTPVAQGAAASNKNKELINRYLKETGLTTKKMTIGEYWKMVRHVYPKSLQVKMDQWVAFHRNEPMPSFTATTFVDKENVEQVRVTLGKEGQTFSMTFTGDEDAPVKVNSVTLTKNELLNYEKFDSVINKIISNDKAMGALYQKEQPVDWTKLDVFSAEDFNKFTPQQKAEYLYHFRQVLEAADRVMQKANGDQAQINPPEKYQWVLNLMFGDNAWARVPESAKPGNPCIIAGFISKYGENNSCGGQRLGAGDLRSQLVQLNLNQNSCGGGVPCNPLVYGLNTSGKAFCVEKAKIRSATKECNSQSPLRANEPNDKKRIIESYMKFIAGKSVDLQLKDGKISEDQKNEISDFINQLNGFIDRAKQHCSSISGKLDDQEEACRELETRYLQLETFANTTTPNPAPEPPPAPTPPVAKSCSAADGQKYDQSKDKCVCSDGKDVPDGGCPVEVVVGKEEEPRVGNGNQERRQDPTWWQKNKNWVIPLGVTGAMLGLFWWMTKSKAKTVSPTFVPPAPAPNPTPSSSGSVAPQPPVNPPPPAPTVITGPPVIPGEGSGKSGAPMGSGVR